MAATVKTALAAICVFTLLATAYLSASLLILRPPRANYQQWALVATLILVQSALTLAALWLGSKGPWLTEAPEARRRARYLAMAGGVAIAALGASSVYGTISGTHFEGYALVLGSALIIQGLMTIAAFLTVESFKIARSH
jgi:hypothetical protein